MATVVRSIGKAPTTQSFLVTGTTTGWLFTISTSSTVSVGDTYTNNGNTYTVLNALSAQSGQVLFTSGAAAPASSGNLVRTSGAGTSTIAFTATLALATYTTPSGPTPLYIRVSLVGAGGGGGPGGAGSVGGSNGTASFFGPNLLIAGPGLGGGQINGTPQGAGGTATVNGGLVARYAVSGGDGGASTENGVTGTAFGGMTGGSSFLGGGGRGGYTSGNAGSAGKANTGGGGGAGGAGSNQNAGEGGGAGAFIECIITSPAASYPYAVGAGGAHGVGSQNGGDGGSGLIVVEEHYA
jgi:hypothetical protein